MDDQQTYLLNGLLARQYALGRIVRFREIARGRQAASFEILTAQQNEYLVSLFPPAFDSQHLDFVANAVNTLDAERFSVVPILPRKEGAFVGEGPQNTHLLVSLNTAGSALPADQYTLHDLSQVGLRLAWMHRLLREKIQPASSPGPSLLDQLDAALAGAPAPLPATDLATLRTALALPPSSAPGWAHGDLQPHALLHDADHQLRTLVDWALLHPGDPLQDLVDAILTLCTPPRPDAAGFDPRRAAILLEAYDSLIPLKNIAWTPVVAAWAAQRLIDAAHARRPAPNSLPSIAAAPERLAVALASLTQ